MHVVRIQRADGTEEKVAITRHAEGGWIPQKDIVLRIGDKMFFPLDAVLDDRDADLPFCKPGCCNAQLSRADSDICALPRGHKGPHCSE